MENYTGTTHQKHALELATRKRRKEKREEEDSACQYHEADHELSEEMFDPTKDNESKQSCQAAIHHQSDRFDMEVSLTSDPVGRKTLGNVISVIQHTNSLNRSQSEKSDSYHKYHSQRQEHTFRSMEVGESREIQRSTSRLDLSMAHKLVRQPNILVPEIRVTVEPDSPEKTPEVPVKEPEKHVEEFQWPQRSETLSQFPPEKLPPKKKRLRLADIEHSSGDSSFESACTSLSRSPSQDSNLSYSSSFSFDREDNFKSVSPGKQDEFGKPLELLAVPGSGHSLSVLNQRQQHEMRRSSSEQAPCNLRKEFPEARSVSFDYGSLSPTSKVRHGELSTGYSTMKERTRGNLVRQESLNMDPEFTHVPPLMFPQFLSGAHAFTATSAALPQALPIFASGNPGPMETHAGLLVPVRIQTNVPPYGSITYTTVSQISENQYENVSSASAQHMANAPGNARAHLANPVKVEVLDLSPAKLKTGIPLSLTSWTISTTNASSGGSNKRLVSPVSIQDLFMEVKQQKRVKEEKMFGQIVEELSAVELGTCNFSEEKSHGTSSIHPQEEQLRGRFLLLQQTITEPADSADSAMDSSPLEFGSAPYSVFSVSESVRAGTDKKAQLDIAAQLGNSQDFLNPDVERPRQSSQYPSLRTTTGVSWCYLNYTKPSSSPNTTPFSSVYATWRVGAHNPNPSSLSTGATLALLRSKQRGDTVLYTMAAMFQPGTGRLVSSLLLWRQRLEQLQRKPELKEVDVTYGKKIKDTSFRGKSVKDDWREREASPVQPVPTRIKIFEGGYKSNEEYVYVRGRGRGKYICEECGIRCKKPSMLKKHIRTHTDVRPYVCRVCNFAFKTKGNLTKHMKSKAHMKKCLELGVSVTLDDAEILELESKAAMGTAKHQFSDAEDSDGMDEDLDEIDEEDDEDEDYDGDSTPKIPSRSTSPQPCLVTSLSVAVTAVVHALPSPDLHGCSLTSLPGVEVHPQATGRRTGADRRTVLAMMDAEQREKSLEEDSLPMLSPENFLYDPYSPCLLSPGWESPIREPSPSRLRYPSPRRELSPRGRSSSPRWDTSPLRPSSPSLTPIQHLSPGSIDRSLSPAVELAGKREPSTRGRQRVVLRAVSPRRGSHQHRGTGDKTRHQVKADLLQQQGAMDMELDYKSSSMSLGPCEAGGGPLHPQNLLSHLPLHSQQQRQTLLPLGPVGGIQPVQSSVTASSATDLPESPGQGRHSQPPTGTSEDSVCMSQTGSEDPEGHQPSNQPSYQVDRDSQEKSPAELLDGDTGQEEGVQTCLNAIASLKITSEDPQ